MKENTEKDRVEELAKFEQEWRKEITEKGEEAKRKENDKAVQELFGFELKQREKEGDEEGLKELSNYWLKFKIDQVEVEWKVEKFNKYQTTHRIV